MASNSLNGELSFTPNTLGLGDDNKLRLRLTAPQLGDQLRSGGSITLVFTADSDATSPHEQSYNYDFNPSKGVVTLTPDPANEKLSFYDSTQTEKRQVKIESDARVDLTWLFNQLAAGGGIQREWHLGAERRRHRPQF